MTRLPAGVAVGAREPVRLVWENEVGGQTFEVGRDRRRRFVKWAPRNSGIDLSEEARRMRWAADFTPVPQPLEAGSDASGAWLVTSPVPGRSAVDPHWLRQPRIAVAALGEGLRALHEVLPTVGCPFSWSADERVADARCRAAGGLIDPARWHAEHRDLSVQHACDRLGEVPAIDRLVICHGDACAPNTLLSDDGRWSGHVDLGRLGLADRWADLAIATWSTVWNYGPGWEGLLLQAYGITPDRDRMAYYRLLWDLGP